MSNIPGVFTREELQQQFEGVELKVFKYDNGAAALVSPHGARLVGLFHGSDEAETNGVWNHPDTRRIITDLQVDAADILGGLRGWIGNETAFHLKSKDDEVEWNTWYNPSVMDPGNFETGRNMPGYIVLTNKGQIENVQLGLTFPFTSRRSFTTLDDPYTNITKQLGVTYTGISNGYTLSAGKSLEGELVNPQMNPWTLNMLFAGTAQKPGTSISLVKPGTAFVPYMKPGEEQISEDVLSLDDRVTTTDTAVYFRTQKTADADGNGVAYKIGVAPEDLAIIDGYAIGMKIVEVPDIEGDYNGTYELTVTRIRKNDLPKTQEEIYDRAKINLEGPKGSRQVYSGPIPGNDSVAFGEEEFQLGPLMLSGEDTFSRRTEIQTLQYRGNLQDIMMLAQTISGGVQDIQQNLFTGE